MHSDIPSFNIPLLNVKGPVVKPLFITQFDTFLYNVRIHCPSRQSTFTFSYLFIIALETLTIKIRNDDSIKDGL